MADYRFTDMTQVPDLIEQVTALNAAAFAEYEGAPTFDDTFTEWYMRRPGCERSLCVAALDGDEMVSMVLVAIEPLQLGGQLLQCGIIDSVATRPDHRKQGLARRLMDMAHETLQAAGADAGVLYTNPAGHPYKFYGRLGYETRSMCQMMEAPRPGAGGEMSLWDVDPREGLAIAGVINDFYAHHEGYSPLELQLWEWHKVDRPEGMEAQIFLADTGAEPAAICTYAQVPLLLEGTSVAVAVLSDLAYDNTAGDPVMALQSLLAAAPQENIICVVDNEDPLASLYEECGFAKVVNEVSMVLPFSDRAKAAMEHKSGPWYPMVESIVGV